MKAVWKGTVIAESENVLKLEGFYYFPIESIKKQYLKESGYTTYCPWKGTASFYDLQVHEEINKDALWYYPTPKSRASFIKNFIGIWKGIVTLE
jgi:uncharacterized protein (DUF427 family)